MTESDRLTSMPVNRSPNICLRRLHRLPGCLRTDPSVMGLVGCSADCDRLAGGCRRRSRAPAARPCAGWRSSSPLPSGGAGTTGTGAVRGRTRRPTFPAAAGGGSQPGRGRGSPWLPYPVRAGGLGVHALVSDDSGPLWSPWVAWPGLPGMPAWYRRLMSAAGLGSRLASPSRAAGVFTTHDRSQDHPQDRPQESARPGSGVREVGTDPGGLLLLPSAGEAGRACSRCRGWGWLVVAGKWREWLGLRSVGAGLVPPGAGGRGGQVVWGALRW